MNRQQAEKIVYDENIRNICQGMKLCDKFPKCIHFKARTKVEFVNKYPTRKAKIKYHLSELSYLVLFIRFPVAGFKILFGTINQQYKPEVSQE